MRNIPLSIAVPFSALAGIVMSATPAMADEARVEARTGVLWNNSVTDATAGVAAGYDFDLGSIAFIGGQVSADKVLRSDSRVIWGFGGRLGVKTSPEGKAYALTSYETKNCWFCGDSIAVGAGYEQDFGKKYYGKVEYQHGFVNGNQDTDSVTAGVGLRF